MRQCENKKAASPTSASPSLCIHAHMLVDRFISLHPFNLGWNANKSKEVPIVEATVIPKKSDHTRLNTKDRSGEAHLSREKLCSVMCVL